jgi:hypothetical protein
MTSTRSIATIEKLHEIFATHGLPQQLSVTMAASYPGALTKHRHTTVFLYRSVAKLSERAGVLGEDAGNEAPGIICNKHGGHEVQMRKLLYYTQ